MLWVGNNTQSILLTSLKCSLRITNKQTVDLISQNTLRIRPRHKKKQKNIINRWNLSYNQTIGKNIIAAKESAKVLLTYLWWLKRVRDTRNNFIFKPFKWRIRKRRAMKLERLRVSRRRLKNHMAALRGQGQKSDNIPPSTLILGIMGRYPRWLSAETLKNVKFAMWSAPPGHNKLGWGGTTLLTGSSDTKLFSAQH